jgi:acetylornithine deacetylase
MSRRLRRRPSRERRGVDGNRMTSLVSVLSVLDRLVGFDTTSSRSNLELIDWVETEVSGLNARCLRLPDASGTKANLWIRFGPDAPGGVVLSGHTDVVPTEGQPWSSDPYRMRREGGRLYGRGVTDMKGFLALCLAHAGRLSRARLTRPVDFAFSFDEEVGCAGVAPMIEALAAHAAPPAIVWVGEPTSWGVVSAHKGIRDYEVIVSGREAHSSDPRFGRSAIHEAVALMEAILEIARSASTGPAPAEALFDPPWPTLTIGRVSGGTASNILARECRFTFDVRTPPDVCPDRLLAPFLTLVSETDRRLKAVDPACGVRIVRHADAPSLAFVVESPAERLLRAITGDNAVRAAAYATEAGQFQSRGFSAVICGPGSIEQAHRPDEYLDIDQLETGLAVFDRFMAMVES